MQYNFDKPINRWNTDSIKYDSPYITKGVDDFIPLWVADMDFQTPKPVLDSISQKLAHGVLGYGLIPDTWYEAIIHWVNQRFNLTVTREELIFTPGIVRGIAFVIQCFTAPSDNVMVMSPVYSPFFEVTQSNNRNVVFHSLKLENEVMSIDFDQFEKDIQGCKLLILCNPHNPGGRVWTQEELAKIAQICDHNQVFVISDEIHADLTLRGNHHVPYFKSSPLAAKHGITFMSPSKAFNMAGLSSSYAIIKNKEILAQYKEFVNALHVGSGNVFAYQALVSAYEECGEWLNGVLGYIEDNITLLTRFIDEKLPLIKYIKPQASFLVFLDCRALNLSDEKLDAFFREAGLVLNTGISYGKEGSGFMRINVGCTKETLSKALHQLKEVYDKHFK